MAVTLRPWDALWTASWSTTLRQPLVVGSAAPQTARRGLWIALERQGRFGVSDAAPLPGLSRESLDDVRAQLVALQAGHTPLLLPSLSLALFAASTEATQPAASASVESAALVNASDVAAVAAACALRAPRTVKVKVGRAPRDVEAAAVMRLRDAGHTLRLDGNRRLTVDDAVALAVAAGPALAYFEEPVPARELGALPASMPLALDESFDDWFQALDEGRTPDAAVAAVAVAWVLKPTVLGAARAQALCDEAHGRGVTVVVSSAFESPLGRRSLCQWAARVAPRTVHGLGTGAFFVDEPHHAAYLEDSDDVGLCRALSWDAVSPSPAAPPALPAGAVWERVS
jgi:o-succinylbenzoate synthase